MHENSIPGTIGGKSGHRDKQTKTGTIQGNRDDWQVCVVRSAVTEPVQSAPLTSWGGAKVTFGERGVITHAHKNRKYLAPGTLMKTSTRPCCKSIRGAC